MYKVVKAFRDDKDGNKVYYPGDVYTGPTDEERLEILTTPNNRIKEVLIVEVKESQSDEQTDDSNVETEDEGTSTDANNEEDKQDSTDKTQQEEKTKSSTKKKNSKKD